MRPILFYTVGLPGAGKTTFARNFSHWLGALHLRADEVGLELFRFPTYSAVERQLVRGEMEQRAINQLRAGYHVVYDAPVNTHDERRRLMSLAAQNGGQAVGVWVRVPEELAKRRAGDLGDRRVVGLTARVIPPHVFDRHARAFEAPSPQESVCMVDGATAFPLQYRRLLGRLPALRAYLPRLV